MSIGKPTGRPSKFTAAIAEEICDRLMGGESLVRICNDAHMPDRVTVCRWLVKDEAFATEYARARATQADLMDDLILDVARSCTAETALADRVKIGAYQWRAMKLEPKKYGEKLQHTGASGDGPVVTEVTYRWQKPEAE